MALTLTLRDTPATAAEFGAIRAAWIVRAMRLGAVRLHWIVEWQKRGTPHLHVAVYFPESALGGPETVRAGVTYGSELTEPPEVAQRRTAQRGESDPANIDASMLPDTRRAARQLGIRMVDDWVQLGQPYRAGIEGQDCKEISGAVGWLQYLSKHAARGAAHYQRSGHPEGWEKTGRLWGHWGEWPAEEPMVFDIEPLASVRYRRLVRSWRIADARKETDPKTRARRIASARRMLKCSDRQLSPVRGVSEWVSEDVSISFVALLASEGWEVSQRVVDLQQA